MTKPAGDPKASGKVARTKDGIANTWFAQVATRSRALVVLLVAYMASIATALRWFGRDFKALHDQSPSGFWCIVVGPILFIVAFDVSPRFVQGRREKRRKLIALEPVPAEAAEPYFRLDPYVKTGPADFYRQDGVHERVLHWIRETTRPVLFLSGVSGSGKSSLLEGYVLPMLREEGLRIVEVHDLERPLAELEAALAAPRRRGTRLLIVFDQFEEFIILENKSAFEQRQEFLLRTYAIRTAAPPGVCLLFAFRTDYQSAVEALELEELSFRSTWIEIGLFRRSAAREFLQAAPEKPSEELVSRLLNGADMLDDTPGLYRPVTLNIIGLMFQQFDREFTGTPERQVQAYLEAAIADSAIRDIAPCVISKMITDSATKQAQSVESVSAATGISVLDVKACLSRLSSRGLARRLGNKSGLWTLSHDFVARQFALLLRHLRPNPWPRVALIALPVLFVLTLGGTIFAVPIYMERRALTELQKLNVSITGEGNDKWATFCRTENASEADTSRLSFFCPYGDRDLDLLAAAPYIHEAKVYQIDLDETGITRLDPLADLTDLRRIRCSGNSISSLAPLRKLTALVELDASSNDGVTTLEPLTSLTALEELDISQTSIHDLTPLAKLMNLRQLNIYRVEFASITPLAGLRNLRQLDFGGSQIADLAAATMTIRQLQSRGVQITGTLEQATH